MYKILGSDGNEYGPISAEKIKAWIKEDRVERKTPIMPEGAKDWVFLETLPEFAAYFAPSEREEISEAVRNRRLWQLVICVGLLLAALVVATLFMLGKIKHH